jgi:PAS domain S-box-containing protein
MNNPVSRSVIVAVADAEGVDPIDLPPLSDCIDPDALDRLLSRGECLVRLHYQGYTVTVDQRGSVTLDSVNTDPSESRSSIDVHRAMKTAREGMSLVKPDGTFAFVNAAFESIFGYNRNELLGEHWTVLYHDEEAKRLEEEILPSVRETGYWSGETVRLTKHGESRVTDHRLALTDEDVILCTATDITLDRTATQSNPRSFDAMGDDIEDSAFFTLDHEGYVTRWNEEAEHIIGSERSETLGKHVSTFFALEHWGQNPPERLLDASKNKGTVTEEGWLARDDGSQFCGEITMCASYNDAGTIRGFGARIRESPETLANT